MRPGHQLDMLISNCTLLIMQWAHCWQSFRRGNVAAVYMHMQSSLLCALLFLNSMMSQQPAHVGASVRSGEPRPA